MKKKLKSDLVSLAHKILKLDSESDYETLKIEAQKIYEALSILAYVEAHFDTAKPTIGKAEIIKALEDEDSEVIAESFQEIQQEQVEETPAEAPQKEETELERIARIAAANEELFERLRTPEEAKPKAEDPKPKEQNASQVADIKNTGGAAAGSATAAWFLAEFAGDTPWVHLDIAGTATSEATRGERVKGATGTPVRTLVALAQDIASS